MPRLRRLSGIAVINILELFGFKVVRIKGSHHVMKRTVNLSKAGESKKEADQTINVPVHGHKELQIGTLRSIYRDAVQFISEEELRKYFYSE